MESDIVFPKELEGRAHKKESSAVYFFFSDVSSLCPNIDFCHVRISMGVKLSPS